MKIEKTKIEGLLILTPDIFEDERGYFFESYSKIKYKELGIPDFVQDNESKSSKGVLRGLHYQLAPHAQGKLVRVIQGEVLDVAVDIRPGSETFGQHVSVVLSEINKVQFWIPAGFAHGFVTFSETAIFSYKCTELYHKKSERGILWNDEALNIDWKVENPVVSVRDSKQPKYSEIFNFDKKTCLFN